MFHEAGYLAPATGGSGVAATFARRRIKMTAPAAKRQVSNQTSRAKTEAQVVWLCLFRVPYMALYLGDFIGHRSLSAGDFNYRHCHRKKLI